MEEIIHNCQLKLIYLTVINCRHKVTWPRNVLADSCYTSYHRTYDTSYMSITDRLLEKSKAVKLFDSYVSRIIIMSNKDKNPLFECKIIRSNLLLTFKSSKIDKAKVMYHCQVWVFYLHNMDI